MVLRQLNRLHGGFAAARSQFAGCESGATVKDVKLKLLRHPCRFQSAGLGVQVNAAAASVAAALQLDTAIQLLLQASSQQPLDFNVWFTLATALARKVYANEGTSSMPAALGRSQCMQLHWCRRLSLCDKQQMCPLRSQVSKFRINLTLCD